MLSEIGQIAPSSEPFLKSVEEEPKIGAMMEELYRNSVSHMENRRPDQSSMKVYTRSRTEGNFGRPNGNGANNAASSCQLPSPLLKEPSRLSSLALQISSSAAFLGRQHSKRRLFGECYDDAGSIFEELGHNFVEEVEEWETSFVLSTNVRHIIMQLEPRVQSSNIFLLCMCVCVCVLLP